MAWDDAPPSQEELAQAGSAGSWNQHPPTEAELHAAGVEKEEPLMHQVLREGLPIAGQVVGGLGAAALATPETAGVGAVPAAMAGAGAGQAAGAEAAGWLNHAIYGDEAPKYDSLEDAGRVGGNFAIGAASELAGQGAGKVIGAAAEAPFIKPVLAKAGRAITGLGEAISPTVTKEVETGLLDAAGSPIMKTVTEPAERKLSPLVSKVVDKATTAAGAAIGGPAGAVIASEIKPAVGKSVASSANAISTVLQKTPAFFGKWAPVLSNAAARGELSLNASVYVLQQQDPDFRQKMDELNNSPPVSKSDR